MRFGTYRNSLTHDFRPTRARRRRGFRCTIYSYKQLDGLILFPTYFLSKMERCGPSPAAGGCSVLSSTIAADSSSSHIIIVPVYAVGATVGPAGGDTGRAERFSMRTTGQKLQDWRENGTPVDKTSEMSPTEGFASCMSRPARIQDMTSWKRPELAACMHAPQILPKGPTGCIGCRSSPICNTDGCCIGSIVWSRGCVGATVLWWSAEPEGLRQPVPPGTPALWLRQDLGVCGRCRPSGHEYDAHPVHALVEDDAKARCDGPTATAQYLTSTVCTRS
nr:hypothetical protein CFP56_24034 [Quercus suber]